MLIQNLIDYFTEKWNSEKKSFSFKKKSKHKDLKKLFPDFSENNGEIEFKSYRETATQELEKNGKFNKRKLNEFLFVIGKIKNETLAFEIMKQHLYNQTKHYFNVLQRYAFNREIFSKNNDLKLILPASYYNHKKILEWLIHEQKIDINDKNERGETSLHLGNFSI